MNKKKKKGLIALMALTGVSAVLVGCNNEEGKNTTTEEAKKVELSTYESTQYGVTFSHPSDWREDINVALSGGFPTYFIISDEKEADFYYMVNLSFEEFVMTKEVILEQLEANNIPSSEVTFVQEPTSFEVNGNQATEYTIKIGDRYMYQAFVKQTDTRYIIFNHRSLSEETIEEAKEAVRTTVFKKSESVTE